MSSLEHLFWEIFLKVVTILKPWDVYASYGYLLYSKYLSWEWGGKGRLQGKDKGKLGGDWYLLPGLW